MQQYKFRGKRIDNGEWIEGDLSIEYDGTHHISYWSSECIDSSENIWKPVCKWHEVIPETVGQFTTHEIGLYVGDIVNYVTGCPKYYVNAVVEFGEYETYTHYDKDEGDVEQHIGFYINDGKAKIPIRSLWIEKIGNIHDHPHLLNPAVKDSVTNTMKDPNINDPATQQQEPANEQATTEQVAAVEQEAQEQAMESAEEGGAEG